MCKTPNWACNLFIIDSMIIRYFCQLNKLFNTLRPEQNGHHFGYDSFECVMFFFFLWKYFNFKLISLCTYWLQLFEITSNPSGAENEIFWGYYSLQNKIWNLPDRNTILPKFIYDKEGELAGPTQILPVRVRDPALILKTVIRTLLTEAADAVFPCVTRSLAVMVVTLRDKQVLVFH